MNPAVFDFEDIHRRLAIMQGTESSGVRYERCEDGTNKVVSEHDFLMVGTGNSDVNPFYHSPDERCARCGFTRSDVEDNLVPKECSGKKLMVATRLTTQTRGQKRPIEIWRHPDGSTFDYFPSGSLQHLQLFRKWKVEGKKATNEDRFGLSNILDGLNDWVKKAGQPVSASHGINCLCSVCEMSREIAAEQNRRMAKDLGRRYEAQRTAFERAAKASAEADNTQIWNNPIWFGLDMAKGDDKGAGMPPMDVTHPTHDAFLREIAKLCK